MIEAVFEDLEVKRQVMARASTVLRQDSILATNTSYLDIERIAEATQRPQDVIGLHFFSPAHVMKLLEIVPIAGTDPVVQATALALGKRLGKQSVLVGNARGFVGNRMLARRTREAYFLLEEGATPSQVDRAFTDFGFPMGPFAVGDLAGLDIGWRNRRAVFEQLMSREQQCTILDQLVEAGRLGQKAGRGFYRYDAQRRAEPDAEVEALIEAHSARVGRTRRAIGAEEILQRCLFAMIDEGARILGERRARAPSDIDVVWLHGYGFPRFRGGPMHYADTLGLATVRDAIAKFRAEYGAQYWEVAPLLAQLAAAGTSFQAWAKTQAEPA
jgi:3-hydroxyacyl-CoA dehydrogenase